MSQATSSPHGLLARAEQIAGEFELNSEDVAKIARHFVQHMKDGLQRHGATQMPSFVTTMPSGAEKGLFLAVDLGGTNCRLKLGFTFSFTYENESLSRGTMIQWDKGWDIPDAIGRDPCEMLQTAIDDLALSVHVSALASDSVGTLMARAYTSTNDSNTLIGAIFGTGTNAAYVEKMPNVAKLQNRPEFQDHGPESIMIINTEWGAFDEDMEVLPNTLYDNLLDESSANQKGQMLEKRISGLYLGELLRLVICQLMEAKLLDMTVDKDSPLMSPHGIDNEDIIDIGVDGSLFEFYPTFEEDIRGALRDIPEIGPEGEKRISMGLARDGSGVGAALVAQSIE
ncbi:hypothetical protein G7Z17_g3969 [Cylindrodendrum hubeiense]|uniref:Phosphotransferase n=1 Tax=Cylindrodendrum hubeiense TaxID=595255 RepID=A0A9P5HEU0_9HYPO|nr:hypothetical protein G7Z17_g3969 [Cylindrodendrum hubeiense]